MQRVKAGLKGNIITSMKMCGLHQGASNPNKPGPCLHDSSDPAPLLHLIKADNVEGGPRQPAGELLLGHLEGLWGGDKDVKGGRQGDSAHELADLCRIVR